MSLTGPGARGVAGASLRGLLPTRQRRPEYLRRLVAEYELGDLLLEDGRVPVRWWPAADNFGDLMSPWLISRMTGREVVAAHPERPHYLAIGSVLNHSTPQSVVWGTGSFGVEPAQRLSSEATYTAVRGPLSRARLVERRIACPEVYGDPALLAPAYFAPPVRKTHEYGVVARWSERRWHAAQLGPGVRLIDLGTDDVEGVIEAILSCRRVVTGSLHGLIIADAYGIPSAWVRSQKVRGGPFKFFDYFATVGKLRMFQDLDTSVPITTSRLRSSLVFDGRPIDFDYRALLDACPLLRPADRAADHDPARRRPTDVTRDCTEAETLDGEPRQAGTAERLPTGSGHAVM
jgi:pyruvyltransferase